MAHREEVRPAEITANRTTGRMVQAVRIPVPVPWAADREATIVGPATRRVREAEEEAAARKLEAMRRTQPAVAPVAATEEVVVEVAEPATAEKHPEPADRAEIPVSRQAAVEVLQITAREAQAEPRGAQVPIAPERHLSGRAAPQEAGQRPGRVAVPPQQTAMAAAPAAAAADFTAIQH